MELIMPQNKVVEEIKLVSALKNRTVYLNDTIDSDNIFQVRYLLERIVKLDELENIEVGKRKNIILKISSPGGVCSEGLSIISYMEYLKNELKYIIETHILAEAASMAFTIACIGSKGYRFAQKHSQLMTHQILQFKYNYYKLQEDLEDVEWSKQIWNRIKTIIVDNTLITHSQLNDITIRKYDWWMWSEEALELGVIDKII